MSDVSSNTGNKLAETGRSVAWGPGAALVVSASSLLGSQFLAGLTLAAVSSLGDFSTDWFNSTAGQFYFVLISDIFILLALWIFLRGRKAKLAAVGFARQPAWQDAGYAVLAYLVYFAIFIALAMLASALTQINLEQKQELGFDYLFSTTDRLMAMLSLVILPPIVEEVLFRGFMFTGLRKKFKFAISALITSLAFASLHLLGSSEGLLWVAALDTLALSFVLCYLREKTGALWAPMALHAIKNTIAFTILLSGVAAL